MDNTARLTGDLPRLVERIQQSADRFDRRTSDVAQASTGVRADLREAAGEVVPEVRLLASELREVTGSLRRFSQQLEQNPSTLLFGRPAPKRGPGE